MKSSLNLILNKPLNSVNKEFNNLNNDSALFKLIGNSSFNVVDHYSCVGYFVKLNSDQVDYLLSKTKELINRVGLRVFYQTSPDGAACLSITDKASADTDKFYIYDNTYIKEIEDILRIKFCSTSQRLHKNMFGLEFEEMLLQRMIDNDNTLRNNEITICQESNKIRLFTEELSILISSITHINYINGAVKKYKWLSSKGTTENGCFYKHLCLLSHNTIEFTLFQFKDDIYYPHYTFVIEYTLHEEDRVNIIKQNLYIENEEFLVQINKLGRAKRIERIMLTL